MANRFQREINRIEEDNNILLYYLKIGDLLYKYENMQTLHTRKK